MIVEAPVTTQSVDFDRHVSAVSGQVEYIFKHSLVLTEASVTPSWETMCD
jgi:hypothetical protein